MKKLVIGTTNKAKLGQIQGALLGKDISVVGISDMDSLPEVIEDGKTPQENARKKARFYSQALGETVLSMDNALFLDGLPDEKQPGMHVRRIQGRTDRPTDDELITYYTSLIGSLGDTIGGKWEFAICIASPGGKIAETTIISPRRFTSTPSTSQVPGYPLESIQIEPDSGKYISEMDQEEQDRFWQKVIGNELSAFVDSVSF